MTCLSSITSNRKNNIPTSGSIVEIDQNDLLPRSKEQASVRDRNGQGGTKQRRADVREAISIAPPGVVSIVLLFGYETFDCLFQIINCPGLELYRGYTGGGSRREYQHHTFLYA